MGRRSVWAPKRRSRLQVSLLQAPLRCVYGPTLVETQKRGRFLLTSMIGEVKGSREKRAPKEGLKRHFRFFRFCGSVLPGALRGCSKAARGADGSHGPPFTFSADGLFLSYGALWSTLEGAFFVSATAQKERTERGAKTPPLPPWRVFVPFFGGQGAFRLSLLPNGRAKSWGALCLLGID